MPALNKDLAVPLYHQLKCVLMEAIETGQWESGQQLPNEAQLAENFHVSKITVRQALQQLADLGYVRREQGRGTFVSKIKLGQGPRELTSFTEEMRRHNLAATTKVLEQKIVEADEAIATPLEIGVGEPVLKLRRLRFAEGEPMGVQTAYIPLSLASGIEKESFENASLYETLRNRYNLEPVRARETHYAALAEKGAAQLLGIAAGSPVFAAERVTFLPGDKPLEFVKSIMRGDRYSIVLDLALNRAPQTSRLEGALPRPESTEVEGL